MAPAQFEAETATDTEQELTVACAIKATDAAVAAAEVSEVQEDTHVEENSSDSEVAQADNDADAAPDVEASGTDSTVTDTNSMAAQSAESEAGEKEEVMAESAEQAEENEDQPESTDVETGNEDTAPPEEPSNEDGPTAEQTTDAEPTDSELSEPQVAPEAPQQVSASEGSDADTNNDTDDGSFVVLLDDEPDEPDTPAPVVEEEENSDSFLILFDDDEPEDNSSIENHDGSYKILLAGDISFHNIVKLKSQLETTFDAIGIELDATGVEGMDTASAQMLLSYTNNLKNANVPIKWLGTSRTFDTVSNTLGITLTD